MSIEHKISFKNEKIKNTF